MKKTPRLYLAIIILLILWLPDARVVRAQLSGDMLAADMILMDDYGNILSHYTRENFMLEDGYFLYNEPPKVEGMAFETANILELVTSKGSRFRVNYFYSADLEEDKPLPRPVPLSEMPKKGAELEERLVYVSWIDENMRELTESSAESYDFYWDAFEIPVPREIRGYGYQKMHTGMASMEGVELPHFAFVYKKNALEAQAPSLLFSDLVEEGRIRTIKAERTPPSATVPPSVTAPPTVTAPPPEEPPGTIPTPVEEPEPVEVTRPTPKPADTLPDQGSSAGPNGGAGTRPETKPETKPAANATDAGRDTDTEPVGERPETSPTPPAAIPPGSVPKGEEPTPEEPGPATGPKRTDPATRPEPELSRAHSVTSGASAGGAQSGAQESGTGLRNGLILSGLALAGGILLILNIRKK